mmetsp:Transcript_20163/g.24143  ORF Transcript_20163/g.24143 Transcript_20163/m.24143 type:complete len:103 (-) Transcript_20163:235-543(-)
MEDKLSTQEEQTAKDLQFLEALETFTPAKLRGIHKHFVLFGLVEDLEQRLGIKITPVEALQMLDRFYNLQHVKPDADDATSFQRETGEEFSLPPFGANSKQS